MKISIKIVLFAILCTITSGVFAEVVTPTNSEAGTEEGKLATPPQIPVLKKKPTRLTVTGSLSPEGMERVGKPMTVLNKEELKQQGGLGLGDALATQPGVSTSGFAPGASRPIIRAQSKERVRILENGLDVGDVSSYSDDHAVASDPISTERIEILRGPSTLLYGSQAIGGVVNMIDGSIAEEAVGKDLTGKIDLRKGNTADDENTGAALFEGQKGDYNWHISGFSRETDDIKIPGYAESSELREQEHAEHEDHDEDPDEHAEHEEDDEDEELQKGTLKNSDTKSSAIKAGFSKVWDRGFWGMSVRHSDSEYGIPAGHEHHDDADVHHEEAGHEAEDSLDHSDQPENEEDPVRIDLEQTRVETRGEVLLDDSFFKKIRGGATYSNYKHKELEGREVGTEFDRDLFEARAILTHGHEEILEGGWGTQFIYDKFSASGDEAFVPSTESYNPALFFVEDYRLSTDYVWQLGGRYEYANINPDTDLESRDFNLFSSSTGLIWHNTDKSYSSALNFSYSQRAPNSTELYADGLHVATQTYETGDVDLDKEKSFGSELIFRKLNGPFRGSSSFFWQHYFDYINLNPTAQNISGAQAFQYDEIEASFWGFELESEVDLLATAVNTITFYSGLDYVRGRNKTDSSYLPRVTPMRLKTGLRYSMNRFTSYAEAVFAAEQDNTADYELPTDSYALLNAGLTYRLTEETEPGAEIYLRATNLTDEEARIHNSFLKDQVPLRGRALLAGLTFNF